MVAHPLFSSSRLYRQADFYLVFYNLNFVFAGDDENVENIQDSKSVDDENCDEPILLSKAGRAPEGETFPD